MLLLLYGEIIQRRKYVFSGLFNSVVEPDPDCVASESESGLRFFKSKSGSRSALQNPVSDPQQCKKVFLKQRTFDHFSNFKYCSPSKVRIEKNTIHLKKSYIRIVIFEK